LDVDISVPGGLPRLFLQPLKLRFQGSDDIVQAFEIGFRSAQAEFRFVSARMQAGIFWAVAKS
jgi:hypothetical protein